MEVGSCFRETWSGCPMNPLSSEGRFYLIWNHKNVGGLGWFLLEFSSLFKLIGSHKILPWRPWMATLLRNEIARLHHCASKPIHYCLKGGLTELMIRHWCWLFQHINLTALKYGGLDTAATEGITEKRKIRTVSAIRGLVSGYRKKLHWRKKKIQLAFGIEMLQRKFALCYGNCLKIWECLSGYR